MEPENNNSELKLAAEKVFNSNSQRLAKLKGATDYLDNGKYENGQFCDAVDLADGHHRMSSLKKAKNDWSKFQENVEKAMAAITDAENIKAVLDKRYQGRGN